MAAKEMIKSTLLVAKVKSEVRPSGARRSSDSTPCLKSPLQDIGLQAQFPTTENSVAEEVKDMN